MMPCAARDESGHALCLMRPRAESREDITSDAGELVMRKGMHLLTALTLTAGSITAAACGKGHDNSASSAGGEVSNAPTTTPATTSASSAAVPAADTATRTGKHHSKLAGA